MRTRSLKPTSQYFILLKGKNSFAGMTLFHSLHCSEFLITISVLINCPIIFCFDMLGNMNKTKNEKVHRYVIYIANKWVVLLCHIFKNMFFEIQKINKIKFTDTICHFVAYVMLKRNIMSSIVVINVKLF